MQQCIFQRLVFWGELDWPGFSELMGVHKGKCIYKYAVCTASILELSKSKRNWQRSKNSKQVLKNTRCRLIFAFFWNPPFQNNIFFEAFCPKFYDFPPGFLGHPCSDVFHKISDLMVDRKKERRVKLGICIVGWPKSWIVLSGAF